MVKCSEDGYFRSNLDRFCVLEQYHEIERRVVNVNNLPKRSTEGERSLIKRFVRSLSMPHELLMSMRSFLNLGKWEIGLGQQIL